MLHHLIDLTLELTPGMRGIEREPKFTLDHDGWNGTTWHVYSHAGTHMDAPVHFGIDDTGIEAMPIEQCTGVAWRVDLRPVAVHALITVADLGAVAEQFQPGDHLLLQTGWSAHADDPAQYRDALPRISEELATWCVEHGVGILGVEPPSVADVNNLAEVTLIHNILLGGGVTIVEGLCHLEQITGQRCGFAAFPLPLVGSDGSPVRAMAWELEDDE